jgi:hypothetical protein
MVAFQPYCTATAATLAMWKTNAPRKSQKAQFCAQGQQNAFHPAGVSACSE